MKKAFLFVVAVLMITVMALGVSAAKVTFPLMDFSVNGVAIDVPDNFAGTLIAESKGEEGVQYIITDLTINGVANTGASIVFNGVEIAPSEDGSYDLGVSTEAFVGEGYAVTPESLGLELNPGVEYTIVDAVINADGTYDLTIDIEVAEGYMIEDKDLHDGKIPSLEVIRTVYDADNSTEEQVKVTANKDGEFFFKNFGKEDNFIVDCVKPIVIYIDEILVEGQEIVLEADGHEYIFKDFANYGTITMVNSKTDFTKVAYDGAYVDGKGHIQDYYNTSFNSYWPDVQFDGVSAFVNYGTFQSVFAAGTDGATLAGSREALDLGISGEVDNYGTIIFNGSANWGLVAPVYNTAGTLDVSGYFNNHGTLKLGHDAIVAVNGIVNINTQSVMAVVNKGVIETEGTTLNVGNFTNEGEVKFAGAINVSGLFKNEADAVMNGVFTTYKNPVTGKDVNCKPSLSINSMFGLVIEKNRDLWTGKVAVTIKEAYAQHYNKGTVSIVDDLEGATSNYNVFGFKGTLTNDGDFTVEGKLADMTFNGYLVNKGTFNYKASFTKDSLGNNLFANFVIDKAAGISRWDYLEKISNDLEVAEDVEIYPLGIVNDGTMNLNGGIWYNIAGKIVNNGEMNVSFTNWHNDIEGFRNTAHKGYTVEEINGYTFDKCPGCQGHEVKGGCKVIALDGRVFNNGVLNFSDGRAGFQIFENASGATFTITNGTYYVATLEDNSSGKSIARVTAEALYETWVLNNAGKIVLNNGAVIFNTGDLNNSGEIVIEKGANFTNFDTFTVTKKGSVVNNGIFKNFDNSALDVYIKLKDIQAKCPNLTKDMLFSGYVLIQGEFVNNATFLNETGYDVRIEGTLDNVNGKVTNKGMIVNVGTFTSTVEGIDNQFAIHGYDVTYVNKADSEAPADTTDNKADSDTADTKAPTKTPAAQTSDVAVAGFAVIATLALAGVVVAKKVR